MRVMDLTHISITFYFNKVRFLWFIFKVVILWNRSCGRWPNILPSTNSIKIQSEICYCVFIEISNFKDSGEAWQNGKWMRNNFFVFACLNQKLFGTSHLMLRPAVGTAFVVHLFRQLELGAGQLDQQIYPMRSSWNFLLEDEHLKTACQQTMASNHMIKNSCLSIIAYITWSPVDGQVTRAGASKPSTFPCRVQE